MFPSHQELEVKFFVHEHKEIETHLLSFGAQLIQPLTHESNLRFDTPNKALTNSYRVLRLRQDSESSLTYKGPGNMVDGVRVRQELEFTVGDFDTAQALLEALGYEVVVIYEKYRASYNLGTVHIMLDEMPYGNFVEIEGPDGLSIQSVAQQLGLDWKKRILDSYMMLFQRARQSMGFTFRDLSFSNFEGLAVSAEDMGVELVKSAL